MGRIIPIHTAAPHSMKAMIEMHAVRRKKSIPGNRFIDDLSREFEAGNAPDFRLTSRVTSSFPQASIVRRISRPKPTPEI